jgi:hypothetical protein
MPFALFTKPLAESLKKLREKEHTTDVWHEDQTLGQKVGRFEVRCKYKAHLSKWMVEDSRMQGLLRFNFEYRERHSGQLESATVQVEVRCQPRDLPDKIEVNAVTAGKNTTAAETSSPAPNYQRTGDGSITVTSPDRHRARQSPVETSVMASVTGHAPHIAIRGPQREQHVRVDREINPEITVDPGMAEVSGKVGKHDRNKEYDQKLYWTFRSGDASAPKRQSRSTRADFTWAREAKSDSAGLHRSYAGALVVQADKPGTTIILKVTVTATPFNKLYHARSAISGLSTFSKDSEPIGPRIKKATDSSHSETPGSRFAQLLETLQQDIHTANDALACIGTFYRCLLYEESDADK